MHAEAIQRQPVPQNEGLGRAVAWAVGLHLLLAVLLLVSPLLTWDRERLNAAGSQAMEATLDVSAADQRAVQRALAFEPEPLPEPVQEPAPEETVPPPQPIPEPAPQDAPVERQAQAQERIPVPDTVNQDEARRDALAQEKALKEQEAKRRQEQIDLTERQRQEQAEQQRRLAAQQEEADRQKKLEEIRRQRAQATREAELAEQKLRQVQAARERQAASAAAPVPAAGPAGAGGSDEDLRGRYAAAIQEAVLRQWTRPESVPVGTRCRVVIRQLPGGEVVSAEVQPGCAMDAAGQDSVERAVLKAQPLPYRGFETVFSRTLTLNFEARDR